MREDGKNTNSKFNTEPRCDEKFLGDAQVNNAEYSNVFEKRMQALSTKLPSEANPAWHIHQVNVPNIGTPGINFYTNI
ncbi:lysine--tRNA ligase [Trichonephila clavipes]|nr:lysine--tRNA ligase [Trichonephila clavipes]